METMHVTKTAEAKILRVAKDVDGADGGDQPGTFEAMVSMFGNKDRHGDVVAQGAFTRTLAEWVLKDRPVPVMWSHNFHDVEAVLGEYLEIKETDEGLWVKGLLDISHAKSALVYKRMQQKLITEFSWSGEVRAYELLEDDEDSWWPGLKILDVDLWEAGPCFKGSNPDTELISVKADGTLHGVLRERGALAAKAGRKISAANLDRLKDARGLLDSVISEAEPAGDEEEETEDNAEKTGTPETSQQKSAVDPDVRAALERF